MISLAETILLKSGRESVDEVIKQGYVIYSGDEPHDRLDRGKIYELLEIREESLVIRIDSNTRGLYSAKNFTLPLHTEQNVKDEYFQAKMKYEKCLLEHLELDTLLDLKTKELRELSEKTNKILENIKVGIVKKYNEK